MTLPVFASKESPLRGSSLPQLLHCSLKLFLMQHGLVTNTSSSEPADTGSMTHRAIEVWHKNGFHSAPAWQLAVKEVYNYRLANLERAQRMFEGYAEDPRNRVETWLVEEEVELILDPWKTDKTKEPIVIKMHMDQVRKDADGYYVDDVKTGARMPGNEMMLYYTAQVCGYALAASKILKAPVRPGHIIRTMSYTTKQNAGNRSPADVFWPYPEGINLKQLENEIRREVARVRRREVGPRPSQDCRFCSAGHIGNCSEMLELTLKRSK